MKNLLIILCFGWTNTFCQSIYFNQLEVGVHLGSSFFLGDLGGSRGEGKTFIKDTNIPLAKLSKGVFASVYLNDILRLRLAFNHSVLEGNDNIINDQGGAETFRKNRNLNFISEMFEMQLMAEIYPFTMDEYFLADERLIPYGLFGVGLFKYKPKGEYVEPNGNVRLVELKPLRLEGQGMLEYPERKEYKLIQPEIPIGIGFKYFVTENLYVGLETVYRKTFTDYIDDVSIDYINPMLFDRYLTTENAQIAKQLYYRGNLVNSGNTVFVGEQRGDFKDNDAFFSTVFKFGIKLNNVRNQGRTKRQMKCPRFY